MTTRLLRLMPMAPDKLRRTYYKALDLRYALPRRRIMTRIKRCGKARVVFVVSDLAMWRLQDVYDRLSCDGRFDPVIILVPFDTYTADEQEKSMDELREHFDSIGQQYIDATEYGISDEKWGEINPQIIFYQQIYTAIYHGPLSIEHNLGKLICYLPYGTITFRGDWVYNTKYTNLAWKLFYPTELHYLFAKVNSFNKARNVEVVGEPRYELMAAYMEDNDPKTKTGQQRKVIIWAPHFTVNKTFFSRASFLALSEIMLEIADKYRDKAAFVLKPHPRLVSALYQHPDWGREETDAYFSKWKQGENTSVVTGDYIGLFCESDAMIHDCGSFTAEYLYTCKPVMYISNDFPGVYSELDTFGSMCMDLHYKGHTKDDIIAFIDSVVIAGDDPLSERRIAFRNSCLTDRSGRTVGEKVAMSLTCSLFGDR